MQTLIRNPDALLLKGRIHKYIKEQYQGVLKKIREVSRHSLPESIYIVARGKCRQWKAVSNFTSARGERT